MGFTPDLARQLLALDVDGGDIRFEHKLQVIGDVVRRSVPSCTAVSLMLADVEGEISYTSSVRVDEPILASLAFSLSDSRPGDQLVLRASERGAFVLLADDLAAAAPGRGAAILDAHLSFDSGKAAALLAAALADRRWIAVGTGVLIGEGRTPEDAAAELRRRAASSGESVAESARAVAARWVRPDHFDEP